MTENTQEILRFLLVASAGLVIDITVASVAVLYGGLADIPAAAIGLGAGMVFNYVLHLLWTFRGHSHKASLRHFLRFATGVAATLVVRAAVLGGIEAAGWQPLMPVPVRLFIGAAVSFVLSYLICRYLVFRNLPDNGAGA